MSKNWNKGEEITASGLNNQGLKVVAQDTPGLTLYVNPGVAIVDGVIVKYAGGNTGTISAPAANPRIDLIAIDSAGAISIVAGVEGASPSAPAYPSDKTVLAEVYCKVGMTSIVNVDETGKGYIYRDSRPLGAGISLIKQADASTTDPANDENKGVKLESDGQFSQRFIFDGFGDGSDGDVVISSPTTLTRDMHYNNLTVNSNLTTNGFVIFVKDTIDGNGSIIYPTPTTPANENGANAFTGSSYGILLNSPGGAGGGAGTNNGSGGIVGGTAGTGGRGTAGGSLDGTSQANRKGGAGTPRNIGGAGGAGGAGATALGSSSGGRAGGKGGGGGASGGIIVIFARIWAGSFTIQALGGNGGNGLAGSASGNDPDGGGAGGAGGDAGSSVALPSKIFTQNYSNFINLIGSYLKQDGTFGFASLGSGAGGGGGGGCGTSGFSGSGGGGGGGAGGFAFVYYMTKTWTGSFVLTGGTGGTGGTYGNPTYAGSNGSNGSNGVAFEIAVS